MTTAWKTTAWKTQHRRSAVIHDVLTRLERARDGELPWEHVPSAVEVFGQPSELLRALQLTWITRLAAALDLAVHGGGPDPVESVQLAWYDLAWRYPGLRRVLDRCRDHAAVAPGRTREHQMLAVFAGLASLHEPPAMAAARGRRLVSEHHRAAPARGWAATLLGLRPARSVA